MARLVLGAGARRGRGVSGLSPRVEWLQQQSHDGEPTLSHFKPTAMIRTRLTLLLYMLDRLAVPIAFRPYQLMGVTAGKCTFDDAC